jgi:hypothetical protein
VEARAWALVSAARFMAKSEDAAEASGVSIKHGLEMIGTSIDIWGKL